MGSISGCLISPHRDVSRGVPRTLLCAGGSFLVDTVYCCKWMFGSVWGPELSGSGFHLVLTALPFTLWAASLSQLLRNSTMLQRSDGTVQVKGCAWFPPNMIRLKSKPLICYVTFLCTLQINIYTLDFSDIHCQLSDLTVTGVCLSKLGPVH